MRSCTECVDKLHAREDSGLGLGLGLIVSHNLKLAPFMFHVLMLAIGLIVMLGVSQSRIMVSRESFNPLALDF